MEIKVCTVNRDLPPEREVREVIRLVCEKTGLDFDRVRLNYIGGDRRKHFPRKGIKLMRACEWTVQVYIGCDSETVESHFSVIDGEKRSQPGNDLFRTLNRICNNRVFYVADELVKKARLAKNGGSHDPDPALVSARQDVTETPVVPDFPVPIEPTTLPQSPETPCGEQEDTPLSTETEQIYKGYFDDPAKLHLAVCALVALANEDCEAPFPFELFERVLKESDVPSTAGLPMSLMRAFLYRNFMVRINPNRKPARYTITIEALEFARGKVPNALVKTIRQRIKPDEDEQKDTKAAQRTLVKLKKIHDDHRQALSDLQNAEGQLVKLQQTNIEAQERDIDGQVKNLQKRLQELAEARLVLTKQRAQIATTEQRVAELKEKVGDPEVKAALTEFEELRKLLS